MGKPRKSHKKFLYNTDRRKAWKKANKLPKIECKQLKEAWDKNKSVYANLAEMGLSANPNKTIKIKSTKDSLIPMDVEGGASTSDTGQPTLKARKGYVADALEEEANLPRGKRDYGVSRPMVQFCVYMMDKYGEDYKAMAKDSKNYYQDTPKQIKKKINHFKNSGAIYETYLKTKGETSSS